jgi:hypothetical protein
MGEAFAAARGGVRLWEKQAAVAFTLSEIGASWAPSGWGMQRRGMAAAPVIGWPGQTKGPEDGTVPWRTLRFIFEGA